MKFTGDGVLAEFPTAQSAVACALGNPGVGAAAEALQMRIGLHLGDIYLENGDVYGDGVNVASRLQELAEVGGISSPFTTWSASRFKALSTTAANEG